METREGAAARRASRRDEAGPARPALRPRAPRGDRAVAVQPPGDGRAPGRRATGARRDGRRDERRLRVYDLPGAFELPLAAQAAARSGRFDAVVALGAVIEGDTDHYEHVAREAALRPRRGRARDRRAGGLRRAHGAAGEAGASSARRPGPDNKGAEAARAAVMTALALRDDRGRDAARRLRAERAPRPTAPADGTADEGAGVRLPAALPVGDHRRARWSRWRRASGGCARARRRCAPWPSAWPAGRSRARPSSTRRSPRRRRNWRLDRIAPVDRTILRLGAYELRRRRRRRRRSILDEAVELAKRFGEADSPVVRERGAGRDPQARPRRAGVSEE